VIRSDSTVAPDPVPLFRPRRCPCSRRLWHGLEDFLPVTHARWLADRMPHVTTHFPAGEDHTNIEDNNRAAAYAWLKDHL
jgi:hypothetical protein